jgi:2-dehydropantoate 2-reductase
MTSNKCKKFENVIILGAGAIGSYYGALLSKKTNVLFIGSESHVREVNDRGLCVAGKLDGRFHLHASTDISSIPRGTLMLLTTKAHKSEEAIKGVVDKLDSTCTILVLQNGLGNEKLVSELVHEKVEVIRGLVTSGVDFPMPGKIIIRLIGETILPKTATGEKISYLFRSCGLETRLSNQMEADIWRKLAINCVINPLTTLFRIANNEIAVESLKEVRHKIVDECVHVAEEEGIILEPGLAGVVDNTALLYSNLSSMCQDIIRGKKTEIDFLNGRISDLGLKHNVETPVNDLMVALIKFMEGKRWILNI